jgi:GT2 family glycosyltransferase
MRPEQPSVIRHSSFVIRHSPSHSPEVSICVVNRDCRDLLRNCLASLRAARGEADLEVVVVDNGSTDGAADAVAEEFPEVVLLRNDRNRAFAAANNQAARVARGRSLLFLNNDTELPPGTLRGLLDFAADHPDAGLIGPRLVGVDGAPQVSFRRRPTVAALLHRTALFRWTGLFLRAYRRYRGRGDDFTTTRPVEVLMGAALLIQRHLFDELGGWDEQYEFGGEDVDLCTRVGRHREVIYHPAVEVLHLGRACSRQHIGYAHAHTVAGLVRFLRRDGAPASALLLYKAAVTLDAPLQWLLHAGQYLWRRLLGRRAAAERSRLVMRAAGHLMRHGLGALWRA